MLSSSFMLPSLAQMPPMVDESTLDPMTIPKFVNQLVIPPVYVAENVKDSCGKIIRQEYSISMSEFYQQILPDGFPKTLVWGYGGYAKDAVTGKYLGYVRNSPGPSFEAIRGIPMQVKWNNYVKSPHSLLLTQLYTGLTQITCL